MSMIRKHKKLQSLFAGILSLMLVISSMPLSFATPAAYAVNVVDEPDPVSLPDPNTFKYMQLASANSQRVMSTCYYKNLDTVYRYPFVSSKEETIISFTIYASQKCSLKLYEYNSSEMDYTAPASDGNQPYYVNGKSFTFVPGNMVYVGDIVGVHLTDNIDMTANPKVFKPYKQEEYKQIIINAQNIAKVGGASPIVNEDFYGMNDMSLAEYKSYTTVSEIPDPEPKFIRNWVFWNGLIDAGGTEYEEVEDGVYVIVVEPSDAAMSKYPSYLPIKIDNSQDMITLLSQYEFPIIVPFGGDPVNMLDGSFTWTYTDLTAEGAKPLSFERTYKSTNTFEDFGLGYGWTHSFLYKVIEGIIDARIVLPDGSSMYFDLDYDGSYISKEGSPFTFTKHGSGKYTLTKNNGDIYKFNADGNITSLTYANGDETLFTYDGPNLATASNESGLFEFEYNSDDRISIVTCVTGSERRENIFAYNSDGDLASSKNCDGDTLFYTYDNAHNVLSVKDFNGAVYVENQYDSQNRVIAQYEKGRGWSSFDYQQGLTTWTKQNAGFYKVYMDDKKRVTAIEDNAGKEYYVYNEKNQLIEYTDKENNTTSYAYDTNGNKSLITRPDGTKEEFVYNGLNLVTKTTVTDSTGLFYTEQFYVYDTRGNLTEYTDHLPRRHSSQLVITHYLHMLHMKLLQFLLQEPYSLLLITWLRQMGRQHYKALVT